MAIDSVATFLDALGSSGILTAAQLQELARAQPPADEPRALARQLLRENLLTAFQVNQVFLGRGTELRLGPYVLLERLGEGGMGQVFKARHQLMNRVVALKVIRKDRLANPEVVARFLREIKAAAQLSHPNIVTAHDAAQVGDTHFLVTEYVEGVSLSRHVRDNGPRPVAQACDWVRQAALGLQHAHEKGLVHRDIKPGNLLVTHATVTVVPGRSAVGFPDGAALVKILDFGLARLSRGGAGENSSELTQEGAVMGTPDYIAPEQAQEAHTADIRSDVYSLGCTFYFLLTGRPPFPGGTLMQKLMRHQHDEPEPLASERPDVSPAVAAVCRKMTAKRPEERFQTPLEVAEALAPFCGTLPPMAIPLAPSEQVTVGPRPPEAVWVPPTLALDPSVGPETVAPSSADSVPSETARRPPSALGRPGALWRRLGWRGRAGSAAVLLALAVLVAVWPRGEPTADERVGLDRLRPEDIPAEDRLEWHARIPDPANSRSPPVKLVAVLGEHRLRHIGNEALSLSVASEGGRRVLTRGLDGTIRACDPETLRELPLFRGLASRRYSAAALAPDGRTAAVADQEGHILLCDAEGDGKPRPLASGHARGPELVFSDQGGLLLSACEDKKVRVWDTKSGRAVKEFECPVWPVRAVAFSRDAGVIAAGGGGVDDKNQPVRCGVQVWDNATGEPAIFLDGFRHAVSSVAFSPDQSQVATGSLDGSVRVWDARTGKLFWGHAQHPPNTGVTLAFSTDGKHLVSAGGNQVTFWDAALGRAFRSFRTTATTGGVAFLGNGLVVVTSGDTLQLWDPLGTGDERRPQVGHTAPVRRLAFSPDERRPRLISVGRNERILDWDLTGPRKERAVGSASCTYAAIHFGPVRTCVLTSGANPNVGMAYWDADGARKLHQLPGVPGHNVNGMAFVPEGRTAVAACSDGTLRRWNLADAKETDSWGQLAGVLDLVALSAEGPRAVTMGPDGFFRYWDLNEGKAPVTFRPDGGASRALFAPDGRVYYGTGNGGVGTWDPVAKTSTRWMNFHRHTVTVSAMALSPDGSRLATACTEGRVVIWDTNAAREDNRELAEWMSHTLVHDLAFAPDGRHLAAAHENTTIYIYRLGEP